MKFSVIIPAYNEEQYLPRLLDSIEVARSNYSGGLDAIEVIVADNDSTDRTAEVAAARGARVVTVKKRRIAAARNGGGHAAKGEILCFIDGDSAVHPQTFDAIDKAMSSGRYVGGATGIRLERKSLGLLAAYCMYAAGRVGGIDTGVVFCRREDFEAVGGYDESRLYAEDVLFPLALRRLGRNRGQRTNAATEGEGARLYAQVRSVWRLALFRDAGACNQESGHRELERRASWPSVTGTNPGGKTTFPKLLNFSSAFRKLAVKSRSPVVLI